MRITNWAASAMIAAAASSALAQDASVADLKSQIDSLQKQVNQIEARQAAAPQVEATKAQVSADALKQSTLVAPGAVQFSYDNGFKLSSADGKFVLKPGVLLQFRNITNYRTSDPSDTQNGFELRRVRIRFDGNAFTKDFRYSLVLDSARNTGSTTILDAWGQYNFLPEWGVKFGQFRNSWSHEGDVSDNKQLADERGLIDYTLAGSVTDRVQGVALTYGTPKEENPIQGELAFTDGDSSKNTDFRDADPATTGRVNGNFGASGRFSYKWFGNWNDYYQFSSRFTKKELFVTGVGADFSENGSTNVIRTTVDAQYNNPNGLSAYVAANYNDTSGDAVGNNAYGLQGQVGYVLAPEWEVFGRYEYVHLDAFANGEDNYHEITGGVNYFFGPEGAWGNALKMTVDVTYLPNGSPGSITGLGYLAGTADQFVLRAQLQLQL